MKRHSAHFAHEDRIFQARPAGSPEHGCRRRYYGPEVAEALEARLRYLIDHIRHEPDAAPRIEERPGVRVIPLIKYPYKIFYRTTENAVRVLHIRHTSRLPW